MASNWQQTYNQLKKKKKEIDKAENIKEIKKINEKYNKPSGRLELPTYTGTGAYIPSKKDDSLLSAFNDGYDMWDISKTILKGGKKLAVGTYNVGKEFVTNPIQTVKTAGVSIAAGIDKADTALNNATDDFFDWILKREDDGKPHLTIKEQARLPYASEEEKLKVLKEYEEAYGKDSLEYKNIQAFVDLKVDKDPNAISNILNPKYYLTDTYKKAQEGELSKGQETIWGVGETIGNMLPSVAVSTVASPLAGSTLFFTQAQQNYTEEAKTRGYTDKEARTYGFIMGGAEVLVERLGFDELGGLNKLATGSIKKAMAGEGLEEFVMPYIDSTVKSVGFGEEFDLQGTTEEAIESAVMGAVTGGIMNAGGKGLVAVDRFIEKVNSGQEITQEDFVEAGRELEQADPNYFNEIMKDVPKVVRDQMKSEDIAPVQQAGQQDIAPVQETTVNPKQQNYQYKAQATDSIQRKTISEDASKYANNTTRTHEFVDTVVNVSEATGETIRLTNNQSEEMTARRSQLAQNYARINNVTIEEATKRFENTTIDAYNTGKEIVINLDSPRALNRLVGHEVTHSLEGTNEYSKLQKIAIEYAKTKGEYNDRVSTLQALYEGTNANIDNELTSDLVGDYLFTDQQFVNQIHTQDRNLFQRIYDEIKHLIKMATSGSKEARQLEQLKHSFEKAMRENKASKTTTIESKSNSATEIESNTQEKEKQVTKVEETEHQQTPTNTKEETVPKRKTMTQKRMETLEGTTRTNQQGYEYVIPKSLFQGKRTTKAKSDSITLAKYGEGEYYTPRRARAEGYGKVTEYNNMEGKFQNPYIQGTPYNSKMIELLEDFKKNNPDRASHVDKALKQGFPLTQEYMTPQEIKDLYLEAGYDSFIGGTDSLPEYLSFTKTNESVVSNITDNKGRALTKEQEAFFKDSKVRDENGNLLTMYHGTSSGGHTVFDPWGAKVGLFGQGSYFTDNQSVAESYTEKGRGNNQQIYEVYLNITNPIDMDAQGDVQAWAKALSSYGTDIASHLESGTNEQIYRSALDYLAEEGTYDKYERAEIMAETFEKMGYDGITHIGGGRFNKQDGTRHRVYISLDSTQVKNVDNLNPTSDADIRYSLSEVPLEQRVTGDELLDAQDLIEELESVGAKIDENGYVTVYHATTKENAQKIIESNQMKSNEPAVFFSTSKNAQQSVGRGGTTLEFRIPVEKLVLDDIFTDNADVKIPLQNFQRDMLDVSEYLVKNDYSLSNENTDIAPTSADIYGSEIKLQQQVQEAIAPLQETIQELNNKITELQESIAPVEGFTDEDISLKNDRNFENLENQNIALIENTTPEYQYENSNEETPINDPFKDRDIVELGKDRKAKAYMVENPEVKPYFQQAAGEMLTDLDNSIKGEKIYLQEFNPATGLMENNLVTGTQRLTTDDLAYMRDTYGYTTDQLREGLNAIINDDASKMNLAIVKRLEFMLHDRLMDGYKSVDGFPVPPSQEYRNLIDNMNLQAYTDQAYQEWSSSINQDELLPIDNASNMNLEAENIPLRSDLAPTKVNTPVETNEPRIENIMFADPTESLMRQAGQQINEGMTYKKSEPRVALTKKQQAKNMVGKLQDQYVNRNYYIDKMAKDTGNKQIKIAGDMVNNFWAEIDGEIFTAQTDNNGNAIGDSLSSLFEPSKKGGYYEAFNDYLMHQSNIDRHQVGKGSVVPLEYSRKMVAEYEKMYPNMRAEATKVWKYGKNLLANMQSNGLISGQFNSTLQKMYPHYVPFMFDQEYIPFMSEDGTVKPKKAIKRAEGGAYEILEIEEAFAKYTYRVKRAVRENSLYKEVVKSSNEKVSIGADVRLDPTNMEEGFGVDDKGNYFVTAYVNGEMQQATISEDLYNELTKEAEHRVKAIEERYELITKPLQKASEIRRNLLTTWSPTFLITNPVKDIQDAVFNSKYTGDFLKFYPSSFKELAQAKTKEARQFLTLYGSGNTMGEYNTDTLNPKAKNNNFIKKLGNGVSKANNILELAPRFAEFKASLKNGTSVQEAVYNAREVTLNFGRGGYITKSLNRNGFTFLNASVQGFDKLIRNFSGENGAKGIVSSFAKVGMFALAPALINALAFGTGDDEDEDYKALPDYIKDNYYLIKTEDGEFIRIPKGRMLSVFGSAARRTLELLNGEKDAFKGYLTNAYSQVGVQNPLENNLFAPIIQAFGSKEGKTWYGGDLVPTRLQDKPAEEQYDETTDEFSKWLATQLNKVGIEASPYKLNYILDQYSGGIGDLLLPTITEEASSDGSFLAPIKDKFTANSTSDNKYVSEFYDKNDELKVKANSSKATEEDILKNKYMYSVSSEMSKLYQERRDVQNDDSLSKFEKYVRVQKIQDQINSLAEEGLKNYEKINKTSNYAIVGDREYYKNANDEWKSPYDDELDELNSLGMDIDEKSDYFNAKNSIYEITEKYKGTEDMYAEKKAEITNVVKNSNLTDDQKGYLYAKYYAKEKTQIVNALDMDFNSFLDYESQNFVADKNAKGESINGSKKTKVFDYINSLNGLSFEEKVILAKLEYNSYDEWNYEIIDYLNNSPITYEEEVYILKKLGFEVDNEGNIYWK
jgi:hypothetical protein